MFEDSITYLAVLNAARGSAGLATMPAGSGGFFTADGAIQTSAIGASTLKYYFAWKDSAGVIHKSGLFRGSTVRDAIDSVYAPLVEEVAYVGFNGTAGAITVGNNTYYGMHLVLNHTFGLVNNSPFIKTVPYKSAAAATQYSIANALAIAANKSWPVHRDIIAELVSSAAVTTGNVFDHDATVVNGSTTFSVATDLKYASAAHTLAVGDAVRFGAAGGSGTAATDSIYRVTAINSLVVTVDRPLEIASGTYANATQDTEVIPSASLLAGDMGIKLEGNTPTAFNPLTDRPFVVDFDVALGTNFGATPITVATGSDLGNGTYPLVSYQEARIQFEDRDRTVEAYPPTTRRIEAGATSDYNIISWLAADVDFTDATTGIRPVSGMRFVVACLDSTVDTDLGQFDTVLGIS